MSTQGRKDTDEAKKVEGEGVVPEATEDDVEGHNMGLIHPTVAWELAKAREREIAREAARHPLIAEAKIRARRKG